MGAGGHSRIARRSCAYRLPLAGWPRVVFESDYAFRDGRLMAGEDELARVATRGELERGVTAYLPGFSEPLRIVLARDGAVDRLRLRVAGREALKESELAAPASRSAWIHAFLALGASAAGFAAGYVYLFRAEADASVHALKMAYHMAAWHLLLTLTLFPSSVWGQRAGIRAVQLVSLLFFFIHAGIAAANVGTVDIGDSTDLWIATWNAVSGLLFLAAVVYGNTAYRDMDPLRGLPKAP